MAKGCCKEYDIIITKDNVKTKIEVKSDRMAHQTGNLAIEYESYGKPSGINATQSDYYIIFTKRYVYKMPVHHLKNLILGCRIVCGGDYNASRMYLLPLKNCTKYII
jgi:predicted AAA+ superfamily ATPase